jgi:hypothetical protein
MLLETTNHMSRRVWLNKAWPRRLLEYRLDGLTGKHSQSYPTTQDSEVQVLVGLVYLIKTWAVQKKAVKKAWYSRRHGVLDAHLGNWNWPTRMS